MYIMSSILFGARKLYIYLYRSSFIFLFSLLNALSVVGRKHPVPIST